MENNEILVISIQSYYANQIFNGTKGFEFRKSPIRPDCLNKKFYVYSAKDDKAFIGTFRVSEVLQGNISEILKKTGYDVRKDRNEIVAYFGTNNPNCYALKLYDIKRFKKPLPLNKLRRINPNIKLPQYYDKIRDENICKAILEHESKNNDFGGNFQNNTTPERC